MGEGSAGQLSIVGTGMVVPEHVTEPVLREIREADWVGHLLDDPHKLDWLQTYHPQPESMYRFYSGCKDRQETYQEIAQRVLDEAQRGRRACLVSYGHPLVYCQPSLIAIERAQQARLSCGVVPSISSQDCLLADLNVDVAAHGFVAMEAHLLTTCEVKLDPTVGLILWQISLVGEFQAPQGKARHRGYLQLLSRILGGYYPAHHPAYIYLAATRPGAKCSIRSTTVSRLHEAEYDWLSTLYLPPLGISLPGHLLAAPDEAEVTLLGLGAEVAGTARLHLTDRCRGLLSTAARVFSLDLSESEVEVLHRLRPDAQDWNSLDSFRRHASDGQTVVVCSGHPCYIDSAMDLLRQGLRARVEPAISRDDIVYGDQLLDPFDFGYQVRTAGQLATPGAHLDTSFSTLYLGLPPRLDAARPCVEVAPSQYFQRGCPKPAASRETAHEVYLARASENLRRELERLPQNGLASWREAAGGADDRGLLDISKQIFYQAVFSQAAHIGLDLAQAGALDDHRATQPDSPVSVYFRLYQWAAAARESVERGYTLAPVRELL